MLLHLHFEFCLDLCFKYLLLLTFRSRQGCSLNCFHPNFVNFINVVSINNLEHQKFKVHSSQKPTLTYLVRSTYPSLLQTSLLTFDLQWTKMFELKVIGYQLDFSASIQIYVCVDTMDFHWPDQAHIYVFKMNSYLSLKQNYLSMTFITSLIKSFEYAHLLTSPIVSIQILSYLHSFLLNHYALGSL